MNLVDAKAPTNGTIKTPSTRRWWRRSIQTVDPTSPPLTRRVSCPSFVSNSPRSSHRNELHERQLARGSAIRASVCEEAPVTRRRRTPNLLRRLQRRVAQCLTVTLAQAATPATYQSLPRVRERSGSLSSMASTLSAASSEQTTENGPAFIPAANTSSQGRGSLGERLSLGISRTLAPALNEGTVLERLVRARVFRLLHDASTVEGHVMNRFFESLDEDDAADSVHGCRAKLSRVNKTMQNVVRFIVARHVPMQTAGIAVDCDEEMAHHHQQQQQKRKQLQQDTSQEARAVQHAVEEYVCLSLRSQLQKWASLAGANGSEVADDPSHDHRQLRRRLRRWRRLPSESEVFGLDTLRHQLLPESIHVSLAKAIDHLHAIGTTITPSRKMDALMSACQAIHTFLMQSQSQPRSPSKSPCAGGVSAPTSADVFLPVLVFAVSRSQLRDPLAHCAFMATLYPFESRHGERMYYLTMLEAALEVIRTHESDIKRGVVSLE